MKKIILPVLALLVMALVQSCSENFNVAAPYKPITVIYGLLDRGDTAHYIRIEKAFLDDNKSALNMAKEPDSNFFNNINVRIQRLTFAGNPVDTIHLTRVDLNAEGYPKDSGTFYNAPSYAYKFKNLLDPGYIYRIIVTNASSGETDSADAPVIDNRNSTFYIYYIDDTSSNPQFEFANTNPNQTMTLAFKYVAPSNFTFENLTSPASVAQVYIRFNWIDSNTSNGSKTYRSYDYDLGFKELSAAFFTYDVKDVSMYNAIKGGLGAAPANTVRLMDRCQLITYLGTNDFYNYIKVAALQGTGLTGNEIQPTFTNIKGKNVLGLFSSRCVRSGYVTITNNTINALRTASLVSEVKIVGTVYH